MADTLTRFTVAPSDGQYLVTLQSEAGDTVEYVASYDQLDLIAEEIDRQLDSDEETKLAVGGDDEEE